MKDYYQALGVSESATLDEIKKAYRDIAKKHHPDVNPGNKASEEKFKEASEAYETLSDPEKRKKYDNLRKYGGLGGLGGQQRGGDAGAPGGFGFSFDFGHGGQTGTEDNIWEPGESFSDAFNRMFGRDPRQTQARRTRRTARPAAEEPQPTEDPFFKRLHNDAYVDINVNLAQALLGSKVSVRTPQQKRVTVKIPAGTESGRTLRVPNLGFQSMTGSGDLYIRLHVKIPKKLNDEQQTAAKSFAEAMNLKW